MTGFEALTQLYIGRIITHPELQDAATGVGRGFTWDGTGLRVIPVTDTELETHHVEHNVQMVSPGLLAEFTARLASDGWSIIQPQLTPLAGIVALALGATVRVTDSAGMDAAYRMDPDTAKISAIWGKVHDQLPGANALAWSGDSCFRLYQLWSTAPSVMHTDGFVPDVGHDFDALQVEPIRCRGVVRPTSPETVKAEEATTESADAGATSGYTADGDYPFAAASMPVFPVS